MRSGGRLKLFTRHLFVTWPDNSPELAKLTLEGWADHHSLKLRTTDQAARSENVLPELGKCAAFSATDLPLKKSKLRIKWLYANTHCSGHLFLTSFCSAYLDGLRDQLKKKWATATIYTTADSKLEHRHTLGQSSCCLNTLFQLISPFTPI